MSTAAFLFMSVSVLSVTVLAGWCYYKVLTLPRQARRDDDSG
ncbi:MAG: hypothetical protein ACREQZ_12425 [Woeseiaceae bacterium]